MIGQTINDRYEITARLGMGAMGTVYRATDILNKRSVALKVISNELVVDSDMLERFKREGEALRQLKHPNIVGFIDAFHHDEKYVIVMEYVSGGNLHDLIQAGPLPIEHTRQIALDLCDALIRAHRLNIIHRDLKPENILIDQDGTPKLADFGVARLNEGTRMTRSGTQVGTPYYMSPEAWEGKALDAQADIWSLGVILFEILTGQVPFGGDTGPAVMTKVFTTQPPDLKKLRTDVPPRLVKIVIRMLTRDKQHRYQTMRQVAVDLESVQPATIPQRPKAIPAPKKREITKLGSLNKNIIGIAGFVVLLLGIGLLTMINGRGQVDDLSTPVSATTFTETNDLPTFTLTPALPTEIPTQIFTPMPTLGVGSTMISEIDGMEMVYVPEGEFTMGSNSGDEKPLHLVELDSFWIDKTEVTNQLFSAFISAAEYQTDATKLGSSFVFKGLSWEQTIGADWQHPTGPSSNILGKENHPVINVSWNDAAAYCEWANKRLPTEAEWEKAARGTDARTYPWGNELPSDSLLNFHNSVRETTEVGIYSNSISPYGALDMAGNVEEWVNDWYDSDYYLNSPTFNPQGPPNGDVRVVHGGSWLSSAPNVHSSQRGELNPMSSTNYIGFRCARSAATEATTPEPLDSLTPTSLPTEITDAKGITMRLVPEGTFMMGSNDGGEDEKPIHEMYLDAYYMDIYEVTNAAYEICVEDGSCELPSNINNYNNSTYADHPVVYVNWNMAKTYCEWRGAKLPSEAEWEKAARGTDARTYPWGEDISCDKSNSLCIGNTTKAGSYESGKSPYGMYDMAGNVLEWVSSLYQPYPYDENDGHENLGSSESRVLRGGSWRNGGYYVRSALRNEGGPSFTHDYIGFRCSRSISEFITIINTPILFSSLTATFPPSSTQITPTPAPSQ